VYILELVSDARTCKIERHIMTDIFRKNKERRKRENFRQFVLRALMKEYWAHTLHDHYSTGDAYSLSGLVRVGAQRGCSCFSMDKSENIMGAKCHSDDVLR
jgi:hypothetical protein